MEMLCSSDFEKFLNMNDKVEINQKVVNEKNN